MRLKLDENLSRHLKPTLAALQHDVTTAADEQLLGKNDLEMAAAATREGRILLTLDLEFADLRKHPPGEHPGVLLFRPVTYGPLAVNRFIETYIKGADLPSLAGCLVVVEPSRVRVRRPASQPDEADRSVP
jgi:predicted nuclease of predicted toxin-antitoxin system